MKTHIIFTVPVSGFVHRPNGNPLGYTRTTQKGKFCDPKAKLYEKWKQYVWDCCSPHVTNRPEENQKTHLNMMIFYKNNAKSDASNIFKGIEDALADKSIKVYGKKIKTPRVYKNDNYCIGSFDFDYDKENPRVEVKISW